MFAHRFREGGGTGNPLMEARAGALAAATDSFAAACQSHLDSDCSLGEPTSQQSSSTACLTVAAHTPAALAPECLLDTNLAAMAKPIDRENKWLVLGVPDE